MKIGDKVSLRPQTFGHGAMEGKVIWLHPKERFAVVEFEIVPQGSRWMRTGRKIRLRESFQLRRREVEQ